MAPTSHLAISVGSLCGCGGRRRPVDLFLCETGVREQGYYRRADASMVLGKHKDALRDFKQAQKGAKLDPDLKRKLLACQKELQRQRFADAVSRAPPLVPALPALPLRGACGAPVRFFVF